jgi:hypothetical protein
VSLGYVTGVASISEVRPALLPCSYYWWQEIKKVQSWRASSTRKLIRSITLSVRWLKMILMEESEGMMAPLANVAVLLIK